MDWAGCSSTVSLTCIEVNLPNLTQHLLKNDMKAVLYLKKRQPNRLEHCEELSEPSLIKKGEIAARKYEN